MAYEKRVCVLKQMKKGFSADGGALSGAVYAERLGKELTVTPRIAGLAPVKEGKYVLALSAGGENFYFEWKGNESLRAENAPSLGNAFSVLVLYVRGGAEPVAYGRCGEKNADAEELLAAFSAEAPDEKRKKAYPLPPTELPLPMPNVPLAPTVPLPDLPDKEEEKDASASPFRGKYDDEAIAASDYFRADDENGKADPCGEREEKADGGCAHENDGAQSPFLFPEGSLTYYNAVRERLEDAFRKYPADGRLKSAFPRSEWVKGEGALLGIIYEEGRPRYLCVATEAAGDPPEEMKENCVFVPETPFSDEKGFYVVFQDADTGEYVKVEES